MHEMKMCIYKPVVMNRYDATKVKAIFSEGASLVKAEDVDDATDVDKR